MKKSNFHLATGLHSDNCVCGSVDIVVLMGERLEGMEALKTSIL